MARFSVKRIEDAVAVGEAPGFAGAAETLRYFAPGASPVQAHLHRLAPEGVFRIGPLATDCVAYVWQGHVEAGSVKLAAGSSLVVEHGATLDVRAGEAATLVTFVAANPPARQRAGGHVHLLPFERVPRVPTLLGTLGTALHADGTCPTCQVWLHENILPPSDKRPDEQWIHSHTEDEVVFVVGGQLRLGNRLFGPGTAVSIAARTLYNFFSGPEGVTYVNFRPAQPGDLRLRNGKTIDEPGTFRELQPQARYLEPMGA